ncbi:MAG TPA: hypothetical protein VFI69_02930 [Candidatus Limnocylindrales bacterium]|nr:hypothetical protein [Candidatus Limnocylindrales bacterium]
MGFFSGVVTGVALAAGAAAWYLSRSGEQFRDRYRVDRKLGELGDQFETRTREIQQMVNAQMSDARVAPDEPSTMTMTDPVADALDEAAASAAEAAAALAADVETKTVRIRKAAKPSTD